MVTSTPTVQSNSINPSSRAAERLDGELSTAFTGAVAQQGASNVSGVKISRENLNEYAKNPVSPISDWAIA
jgi:hypothetical protein